MGIGKEILSGCQGSPTLQLTILWIHSQWMAAGIVSPGPNPGLLSSPSLGPNTASSQASCLGERSLHGACMQMVQQDICLALARPKHTHTHAHTHTHTLGCRNCSFIPRAERKVLCTTVQVLLPTCTDANWSGKELNRRSSYRYGRDIAYLHTFVLSPWCISLHSHNSGWKRWRLCPPQSPLPLQMSVACHKSVHRYSQAGQASSDTHIHHHHHHHHHHQLATS